MAAVVQAQIAYGAGPTVSSAEGGIGFGRNDIVTATTPIPKPVATGTAFSFEKFLLLMVTSGGGTTAFTDRQIKMASSITSGLALWFKDEASYTQATAVAAADAGTNGATPAGYTAMTTSPQTWQAASANAVNSTQNGHHVGVALGVSNDYAGGAGSAIALPNLTLSYTEA